MNMICTIFGNHNAAWLPKLIILAVIVLLIMPVACDGMFDDFALEFSFELLPTLTVIPLSPHLLTMILATLFICTAALIQWWLVSHRITTAHRHELVCCITPCHSPPLL